MGLDLKYSFEYRHASKMGMGSSYSGGDGICKNKDK